jgi:hypothetical protein
MQDDVAAGGDHITAEAHVQPFQPALARSGITFTFARSFSR